MKNALTRSASASPSDSILPHLPRLRIARRRVHPPRSLIVWIVRRRKRKKKAALAAKAENKEVLQEVEGDSVPQDIENVAVKEEEGRRRRQAG